MKLVERFYLPSAGRVLLDGHDIGSYDSKWLRRRMAIVSQEPVLYARSIRDNILIGLEPENGVPADEVTSDSAGTALLLLLLLSQWSTCDACFAASKGQMSRVAQIPSEDDIIAAARAANALDFIQSMPDGFDTDCGDKGVQLSGGQKQRIAIARALVRRPLVHSPHLAVIVHSPLQSRHHCVLLSRGFGDRDCVIRCFQAALPGARGTALAPRLSPTTIRAYLLAGAPSH